MPRRVNIDKPSGRIRPSDAKCFTPPVKASDYLVAKVNQMIVATEYRDIELLPTTAP
jgi:hypothetical protein